MTPDIKLLFNQHAEERQRERYREWLRNTPPPPHAPLRNTAPIDYDMIKNS